MFCCRRETRDLGETFNANVTAAQKQQAFDDLYSTKYGAGLSMLRLSIPDSLERTPGNFTYTDVEPDFSWITQASQRGLSTVWATPWTPPAYMKVNENAVNGSDTLVPSYYGAWATYLVNYYNYMVSKGVILAQISEQNEPNEAAPFESCLWTGPQLDTFFSQNLIPAFAANGSAPGLLTSEYSSFDDSFAAPALADVNAASISPSLAHTLTIYLSTAKVTASSRKPPPASRCGKLKSLTQVPTIHQCPTH